MTINCFFGKVYIYIYTYTLPNAKLSRIMLFMCVCVQVAHRFNMLCNSEFHIFCKYNEHQTRN